MGKWFFNIGSGILFPGVFAGAVGASWTGILVVALFGGLAGAFYSTFK